MIGDIDFVVIPKEGVTLPEMLPPNEGVNWVGDQKAQVIIDGEKVDFRLPLPKRGVPPSCISRIQPISTSSIDGWLRSGA